ncbi:imelysin family protein [Chitinophaga niabensis]|uniref:Imelysin-like domain-containing protein n=1 Tax=Chitinophaga niabensis TaxID=536979 RepID=A0A1N6D6N0_9BACT|nr:imelysin family protein [Chitinophaga niabensis]SIN66367.1 hypothetical protein SAMN04488055_0350 [Chitinophaga niabensis]
MKKIVFVLAVTVFCACSKSSDKGGETPNAFDKTAMLTNYADNLIIPGYTALQQKLQVLQAASDAFLAAPTIATQATLKTAYTDAQLQYERITSFHFGPAETVLLDIFANFSGSLDYNFNTAGQLTGFSIDSVSIENNISTGTYNLATMSRASFYSQGFPALNYLCFGPNAIAKFGTNTAARVKYVKDVLARLKGLVDGVVTSWGTYRADFISNTKTNVGSPIGNMVNQIAYQMDLLKGPRIGWPFGKQSNGTVFATKVEAYFTNNSVALAVENINALKKTYNGGGNGKGLSDYLVALGKTTLNNDILAQFDLVSTKLSAIPDPLSTSLTTQTAVVEAAYKEIQKLLTLIKTDLASATAVQITFVDNDGD